MPPKKDAISKNNRKNSNEQPFDLNKPTKKIKLRAEPTEENPPNLKKIKSK